MKITTLLALGLLAGTASSKAAELYNNTANATPFSLAPGVEFGDQISLYSPDPANTVSYKIDTFIFEYFGTGLSGDEQLKLRFYENDGPMNDIGVRLPGTVFFESGFFPIGETPGETLEYTLENVFTPSIFTWTVEITGLTGEEQAGLNIYTPPTVGANFPSYWQRNGGTFELLVNDATAVDFGAYAEGTLVIVPEPGAIAMFAMGALGLLAFHRRFKSNR
ncbi:MAG: PEP-CTERM sorting domain-containing protein [Verrucomicrobiales bacterium]